MMNDKQNQTMYTTFNLQDDGNDNKHQKVTKQK